MRRLALICATLLFACHGQQAEDRDALSLHTYSLPAGQGEQLRSLLNQVFDVTEKTQARATVTPDGRLIVVGPQKIQEGVQALIDQLQQHPAAPPPTVKLTYWLLVGKPGAASGASGPLTAIGPALKEIQAEDGPQQLTLLEKLENVSVSGNFARTSGTMVRVGQTVNMVGGRILADIHVSSLRGPADLETQLELPTGKLVVLGESGYQNHEGNMDGTLYYVIRADPQTAVTEK